MPRSREQDSPCVGLSHEAMSRGLWGEKSHKLGMSHIGKRVPALPAGQKYHFQRQRSTGLKWYRMVFIQRSPTYFAKGATFWSRQPGTWMKELCADSFALFPWVGSLSNSHEQSAVFLNVGDLRSPDFKHSVPLPCACWTPHAWALGLQQTAPMTRRNALRKNSTSRGRPFWRW